MEGIAKGPRGGHRRAGRAIAGLLLAPVAAGLAGCSRGIEPAASEARDLVRLRLEGIPVTGLGRTHATRRLVPPADLEPWEVFSEGFELVAAGHPGADADGRAAILFAEAGSSVVHIPGSFPLAEFDRVAVHLRCSGRLKLGAWTVRDAEMTGRSSGPAPWPSASGRPAT